MSQLLSNLKALEHLEFTQKELNIIDEIVKA
jgi:hypothetical protein